MSRIEQLAFRLDLPPPAAPVVKPPEDCPAEVVALFERFALEAVRSGVERYSADAVLHRIRWFCAVEKGVRDFKCNNNWTAQLARWFMSVHPLYDGFFETRSSPNRNRED